jgi:membrane-bound metal-dependent hydrolase YbcI (DUF457 family)
VGVGYLVGGWYVALWAGAGYVLHRWFDQDMDQVGISTGEAEWSKTLILAPLVGWSTLYARIIQLLPAVLGYPRGHRSFWSHFPPVGALLRQIFFFVPFWLVFRVFWMDSLWREFAGLYVGLVVADWVHSLADWNSNHKLIHWAKKQVKYKSRR